MLHSHKVHYFGKKSTSYLYFQKKFAHIFQMGVVYAIWISWMRNILKFPSEVLKIPTVLQLTGCLTSERELVFGNSFICCCFLNWWLLFNSISIPPCWIECIYGLFSFLVVLLDLGRCRTGRFCFWSAHLLLHNRTFSWHGCRLLKWSRQIKGRNLQWPSNTKKT